MITVDKDRALELLDLAVQANEPEHKNPQNWNFHIDGTPCCLVGTALNLAGFTARQCYQGIGVCSTVLALQNQELGEFTEEAQDVLTEAQARADMGTTWEQVVSGVRSLFS